MTVYTDKKSNCHGAPIISIRSDEGTCHWECVVCGKPCDLSAKSGQTIKFTRYGKLTIKPDKKLSKKEFMEAKKILDKNATKLGDLAGKTIDYYTSNLLQRATSNLIYFGDDVYGTTRSQRFWDRIMFPIKDFIKKFRVGIAKWIGGSALHEDCGDY